MSNKGTTASYSGNLQPSQTSILPPKLPQLIKSMIPLANKINQESLRKILKVVIKDIDGASISEEMFSNLQASFSLTEDKFLILYSGILLLMQHALRHPVSMIKKDVFLSELNDLRLPTGFMEDIVTVVFSERRPINDNKEASKELFIPSLNSFKWRVDVTISTSALNRVLEPTILMEMENTDGKISTFEVSQSKFHELRYNVAYILKEMEYVEKKIS